jgi:hypothetical protein
MSIDSDSVGRNECFLETAELAQRLAALSPAPRDRGRVALIVSRRERGRRDMPHRCLLSPDDGVAGDAWKSRWRRDPAAQIAVMQADVATMIANGQPIELFGDNLFLDLDLSTPNLPHGTRLRIGAALLEVTPKAHNGCRKFLARFGADALRFVNDQPLRYRNLRGIYMRVVEAGVVATGDSVEVLSREPLSGL